MIVKSKQDLTVTLPAYVAQDNVGGLITFTIGEASVTAEKHAIIKSVVLSDEAAQAEKYHLYFFNASPSAACRTDADTFTPVAADVDKLLHVEYIADTDYITATSLQSVACKSIEMPIVFDGKDLFAVLVAVETPDYVATTDLNITLYLEI